MKNQFVLIIALVSITLSACSMFGSDGLIHDRSEAYKDAKQHDVIMLPPELDDSRIDSIYIVPNILGEHTAPKALPQSKTMPAKQASGANITSPIIASASQRDDAALLKEMPNNALPQKTKTANVMSLRAAEGAGYQKAVKIHNLGTRYWVLTQYSVQKMWPTLMAFLQTQNLQIMESQTEQLRIATKWEARTDKKGVYERYLFKLRPGIQQGTSEVEIVQLTSNRTNAANQIDWSATTSLKPRELSMLKRVAKYTSSANLTVSSRNGEQNTNLLIRQKKNDTYLRVAIDYTRSWAAVQEALNKAAYRIESKDSRRGLLIVSNAVVSEEKKSLFGRLSNSNHAQRFAVYVKAISGKNASAILVDGVDGDKMSSKQKVHVLEKITNYIN